MVNTEVGPISRRPEPAPRVYHRLECRVINNGALTTHSHPNRNRWLIAIGVLKLLKAVLFVSMGFGVIRLLHKDIADVLLRAVTALRFDPENRFVNVLLEKSALLSPHRLKEISFAIFLYAALDIIEGTGLVLEKVWAEYFTLILTGSFLPWEIYEIIRHVTVSQGRADLPEPDRFHLFGQRGQRKGAAAPANSCRRALN